MPSGRQTEVRGLPLLHQPRQPLDPHHEALFLRAVAIRRVALQTPTPQARQIFSRRIDVIVVRLRSAVLVGAHFMSGYSVNHAVLREKNDLFWRNNINHAATHLMSRLV